MAVTKNNKEGGLIATGGKSLRVWDPSSQQVLFKGSYEGKITKLQYVMWRVEERTRTQTKNKNTVERKRGEGWRV